MQEPTTKPSRTVPVTIQKESISDLDFPNTDVLHDRFDRLRRHTQVKQAMKLGNNDRHKVKIIFEDATGLKRVETTIWGVTERKVLLKGQLTIPIQRIHEIQFY